MKKHLIKLSMLALAVALIGTPAIVRAQDTGTNAPAGTEAPVKKKKGGALPFHGKVASVDTTANTVTVGKLVLNVTERPRSRKTARLEPFLTSPSAKPSRVPIKRVRMAS